jgi:Tfp pilus assembly protein PilF
MVRIKQGMILLRQALMADYKNYDAAWRLAMFNYYLGSHTNDNNERDKAFREGIENGRLAVKLQSDEPEGHFWLGANYGGSAQTGILAGLSAIEDIKNEMETVIRLDKTYQGASAYLVLGQVYLEAPKLFGGDLNKAVDVLEKGIKVEPDNSLLRLQMARAYLAVKREKDARQQLNYILNMKPDPNYLPEYKESVEQAHQLLDKLSPQK